MVDNLTTALFEYVQERDRAEFALGDTLDVKTGLVLAGLTFLAIQSGDFIKSNLPLYEVVAQVISILALIGGGILAVCELWPQGYDREPTPEKYETWIIDANKYNTEHPEEVAVSIGEEFVLMRLKTAKERVQTNLAINKRKSSLMAASFWCLITAFAANIATLILRLF